MSLPRCKLVLTGAPDVGIDNIIEEFVIANSNDLETYDYRLEDYYIRKVLIDGEEMEIDILSTVGMESYLSMRDQYMRSADVVVLVYDVINKESFEYIDHIMEQERLKAAGVPIVLVGNNCNNESERKVPCETGLIKAWSLNVAFIEVDPQHSINIMEAFLSFCRIFNLQKVKNSSQYMEKLRTIQTNMTFASCDSPLKDKLIELSGQELFHEALSSSSPLVRDLYYAILIETSHLRDQSILSVISRKSGKSEIERVFDSLDDIIIYCKALRAGISDEICVKVFLVGETGAGKSSLCNAIKEGKSYSEAPPKTIVLDVHEARLDEKINLKLYDAGGDSEYYLISTQFLHSDCIFIITVDGTKYSKQLFQPRIGVYLDVIVPDCQNGYLMVVVTKLDDENFKFSDEDNDHIESQIDLYLKKNESNICFKRDYIWKMSTREKSLLDLFQNNLQQIITNDEKFLDKRKVPFDWLKFVGKLHSPVMEFTEVKEFHNNFKFGEIDGKISQISDSEKIILEKLEILLKDYQLMEEKGEKINRTKLENQFKNIPENMKLKFVKTNVSHSALKPLKNLFQRKKEKETMYKEDNGKNLGKTKEHSIPVETILRFFRNQGNVIWLENFKDVVFTDPAFLLEILRSIIRHDIDDRAIECKLSHLSICEIEDRGLLNLNDLEYFISQANIHERLPGQNSRLFLIDVLEALGLATLTQDKKLFIPALIKNNDLEDINGREKSILCNYENCLKAEVQLDKCGSTGIYVNILVKLKNKKVILQKLFSQKIEQRTNGIISGVEGTVIMTGKDETMEEYNFLLLEKVILMDDPTGEVVERVFGGENTEMATFRTFTIYIKHIKGPDSCLWDVFGIFKDIIESELRDKRQSKPRFRIYCYACCKAQNVGYFNTKENFYIETDLCSGEIRHHAAMFTVDDRKWMWDTSNEVESFSSQRVEEYADKHSFDELYPELELGDQIWHCNRSGKYKLGLTNTYAHVMVYVGNDEIVHLYKPMFTSHTEIVKHDINTAIPKQTRREQTFFLGHEISNSIPVANKKRLIAERALACIKHDGYPAIKLNNSDVLSNIKSFINAVLGKHNIDAHNHRAEQDNNRAKIIERLKSKGYLNHTNENGPILLKEMSVRHTRKLRDLDNRRIGIKNWMDLGDEIFQDDEEGAHQVNQLKKKYVGGSPGKSLLDVLKASKNKMTVQEFQETAGNLGRGDIINLLKGLKPDTLLNTIETESKDIYNELISLLEITGLKAICNWRDFCDELDVDESLIEAHVSPYGSPTKDLLELVKVRKVNHSLEDLKCNLVNIDRSDLAKYIEECIQELKENRRR